MEYDDIYDEEDYDEDFDTFYPQENYFEPKTRGFIELANQCMIPNIKGVTPHLFQLLSCCLLFRLLSQSVNLPIIGKHLVSSVFGLCILLYYFKSLVVHLLALVVVLYIMLNIIELLQMKQGPLVSLTVFAYFIANEFYLEPESWHKIRGSEMLIVMKGISIAFDLDSRALQRLPNVWEFSGYILCAGTSVFGAWVSFHDYLNIFKKPLWNLKWAVKALRSLVISVFFFIVTVCFVEWFIPPESIWWKMYRDALQFRTSHYFVSYLSEAVMVICGFGAQQNGEWHINVCEPQHIELPRSLVEVVVYWNKYMHKWLKQYVFRTSSQYGGLVAVLVTYTVSSLLHGLNYPLAGILLSLGIYTYVEYIVRSKLSKVTNACVGARPCLMACKRHKHTSQLLVVSVCNWCWSGIAIWHLAYLGCIIDTSQAVPPTFPLAFHRWAEVNYISHCVVVVTYLLYFCINEIL